MVQFHALGVLHQIRKSDKLAVTKLVSRLTSSSLRSPYAICLLVGDGGGGGNYSGGCDCIHISAPVTIYDLSALVTVLLLNLKTVVFCKMLFCLTLLFVNDLSEIVCP